MTMLPVLSEDPLKLYCSRGGAVRAWPEDLAAPNSVLTTALLCNWELKRFPRATTRCCGSTTELLLRLGLLILSLFGIRLLIRMPVASLLLRLSLVTSTLVSFCQESTEEMLWNTLETYDKEHGGDGSLRIIEKAFTIDDVLQSQKRAD